MWLVTCYPPENLQCYQSCLLTQGEGVLKSGINYSKSSILEKTILAQKCRMDLRRNKQLNHLDEYQTYPEVNTLKPKADNSDQRWAPSTERKGQIEDPVVFPEESYEEEPRHWALGYD